MRAYPVQSFRNDLGEIAEARMITPGIPGHWKLEDFLSDATEYGSVSIGNETLPKYALAFRTGSLELTAPKLTQLSEGMFDSNTGLTGISAPLAKSIASRCFWGATNLNCAVFPRVASVGQYAFRYCSALKAVDLGGTVASGQGFTATGVFINCTQLKTVVLRSSVRWALSYLAAFDSSPFSSNGTGGTLYVPSALIPEYQAASNWSTILGYANNQIKAIEGSVYETQYADGTPIPG